MSGNALMHYDAARKALAEVRRVDEVKSIHDKAMAMQLYAKQAKDRELIRSATEIRLRAERRAGELLHDLKRNKQREAKGGDRKSKSNKATLIQPKLSDLGVTKQQSSRWQKLADLPDREFESRVGLATEKAEAGIDAASKQKRKSKKENKDEASIFSFVERQILTANNTIKRLWKGCSGAERMEFVEGLERIVGELGKRVEQP